MSLLFIFRRRVCGDANEVRESSLLSDLEERKKAPENHRRSRLFKSKCIIQNFYTYHLLCV